MIHIFFLITALVCGASPGYTYATSNNSPESLITSAVNIAAELATTIRNQQDSFSHFIDQMHIQKLTDALDHIASRAPRDTNSGCPQSWCTPWANCDALQQYLCTIRSCLTQIKENIGSSCGPCCISDTCMGLETLFGFLSCICNKVQNIQSSLDIITTQLSGSAIDELCPCSTVWDIAFRGDEATDYPVISVSQTAGGNYIAIAQTAAPGAGNKVQIYSKSLTPVVGTLNDFLSDVISVRFSPVITSNDTYLLAIGRQAIVGASPELLIYEFDPTVPSLTLVSSANINADVNALAWRANGNRLVIAQDVLNNELALYTVNTTSGALAFNSTLDLNGSVVVQQALDWNPVNLNYAVAATNQVGLNPNLYFIIFDAPATGMSIDPVASASAPVSFSSIAWHPSGNYSLASVFVPMLGTIVGTGAFAPLTPVTPLGNILVIDPVPSVAWNQTGSAFGYVVDTAGGSEVRVHCFTPTDANYLLIDTLSFSEEVSVINWAPNVNFALGADVGGSSGELIAYDINPVIINTILKAVCDISSKIDTLMTDLCMPTELNGITTSILNIPGQVYCLSANMNANLTLDAEDITIDLNGHTLFGTIDITNNGRRILIKNGTIQGNNPPDNLSADHGVVNTSSSSNEINFVDVIINGGGSDATSIKGYTCANIGANGTTFLRCSLQAGQGGFADVGGDGGTCIVIQNTAENTVIIDTELRAGYGGSSQSFSTVSTGNGGHGLVDNGRFTEVRSSFIIAGAGQNVGNLPAGDLANSVPLTTGTGGDGIQAKGLNLIVTNCRILAGSGGPLFTSNGTIGINPGGVVTIGGGGHGINNFSDLSLSVDTCYIVGGSTGAINASNGVATGGAQFIVLAPGHGIFNQPSGGLSTSGPLFTNSLIHGGQGNGIATQNGDIGSPGVPSFSVTGGAGIYNSMSGVKVTNCSVIGGNSVAVSIFPGDGNIFDLTLGSAGDGIVDASSYLTVSNCIIQSGFGGSFFIQMGGIGAIFAPSKAADGGAGIRLGNDPVNSYFALISDSSITAGDGGYSDSANVLSTGTSGAGGIGVYMTDFTQSAQVRNCDIGPTGRSGDSFGVAAISSDGGDGVKIDVNAGSNFNASVEVSNCRISGTGIVGAAGVPSTNPGEAIRDLSCNAFIYSNDANNIADTLIPYTLQVCVPIVAVDAPTGTAFGLGTDRLANVYR